ncbi:hypothetical protein PMAYCL1PPCAC_05083, partial [Pristionchus mayeri]
MPARVTALIPGRIFLQIHDEDESFPSGTTIITLTPEIEQLLANHIGRNADSSLQVVDIMSGIESMGIGQGSEPVTTEALEARTQEAHPEVVEAAAMVPVGEEVNQNNEEDIAPVHELVAAPEDALVIEQRAATVHGVDIQEVQLDQAIAIAEEALPPPGAAPPPHHDGR